MIVCKECKTEIREGNKFCTNCGRKLDDYKMSKISKEDKEMLKKIYMVVVHIFAAMGVFFFIALMSL